MVPWGQTTQLNKSKRKPPTSGAHKQGRIELATAEYLDHQDRVFRVQDCVETLMGKQSVYIEDYA